MSERAVTARVVPDLTGLDKQFDYLVPPELVPHVRVGSIVRVPLGPRRVRAWVVALESPGAKVDTVQLKPIAAVVGWGPAAELVALAEWARWRWAGRMRPFLLAASPPRVVKRPLQPRRRQRGTPSTPTPDGGVVRVPPAGDVLPVVLAAAEQGPLIVCTPAAEGAGLLAAQLRGAGLTVAVLPGEWAAAAGGVDVVVGPRNVVWAPCPDLAGVVVLDEHDEALQDERSPTWHARDVAIERARRAGVPCWLVSPVPTLEALAWAGVRVARPSRLDERSGWPLIEVVDRTRDDPAVTSLVTRQVLDVARDSRQRVVCVLNTKGRARRLMCRACRANAACATCGAAVVQDRSGRLVCARCAAVRPVVCQLCGSTRLIGLGAGVARVRDELEAAVRRPVVEVSSDVGSAALGTAPDGAVLIGTEAVLHRAHDATVVVFLDFDDELLAPRFRAAEEAMTLLVRAARLVGGRGGGGRILIQTHSPRHEVIDAALHADPARLVPPELARRTLLGLPPVRALAAVSGAAGGDWLAPDASGLEIAGPADGRWLVRAASWGDMADGLQALGPRPKGVRVEVDPHRL